eukprot:COSAG05_NODE_14184_length_405_cov_0.754902_1_plen_81_part_01
MGRQVVDTGALQQLRELAAGPHCVGMGECGLDYDRTHSTTPLAHWLVLLCSLPLSFSLSACWPACQSVCLSALPGLSVVSL